MSFTAVDNAHQASNKKADKRVQLYCNYNLGRIRIQPSFLAIFPARETRRVKSRPWNLMLWFRGDSEHTSLQLNAKISVAAAAMCHGAPGAQARPPWNHCHSRGSATHRFVFNYWKVVVKDCSQEIKFPNQNRPQCSSQFIESDYRCRSSKRQRSAHKEGPRTTCPPFAQHAVFYRRRKDSHLLVGIAQVYTSA